MSDLKFVDEHECRYLLTIVGDLGELVLKEVNVRLEAVSQPHPDGEGVVTTPLGFLTSGILCEEGFGDLQEAVERTRWQGVEPLRCRASQA